VRNPPRREGADRAPCLAINRGPYGAAFPPHANKFHSGPIWARSIFSRSPTPQFG